jgi:hypothetical protein
VVTVETVATCCLQRPKSTRRTWPAASSITLDGCAGGGRGGGRAVWGRGEGAPKPSQVEGGRRRAEGGGRRGGDESWNYHRGCETPEGACVQRVVAAIAVAATACRPAAPPAPPRPPRRVRAPCGRRARATAVYVVCVGTLRSHLEVSVGDVERVQVRDGGHQLGGVEPGARRPQLAPGVAAAAQVVEEVSALRQCDTRPRQSSVGQSSVVSRSVVSRQSSVVSRQSSVGQ